MMADEISPRKLSGSQAHDIGALERAVQRAEKLSRAAMEAAEATTRAAQEAIKHAEQISREAKEAAEASARAVEEAIKKAEAVN